mmetsp:Transcript_8072/g.19700  ORF Transcript_8072/g.19700 Transcript_8072/m.19700 type:complete len:262 (+) Transcript_8072:445-1230(+)
MVVCWYAEHHPSAVSRVPLLYLSHPPRQWRVTSRASPRPLPPGAGALLLHSNLRVRPRNRPASRGALGRAVQNEAAGGPGGCHERTRRDSQVLLDMQHLPPPPRVPLQDMRQLRGEIRPPLPVGRKLHRQAQLPVVPLLHVSLSPLRTPTHPRECGCAAHRALTSSARPTASLALGCRFLPRPHGIRAGDKQPLPPLHRTPLCVPPLSGVRERHHVRTHEGHQCRLARRRRERAYVPVQLAELTLHSCAAFSRPAARDSVH